MAKKDLNSDTKEQKYITQKEMAKRFRKTEATIYQLAEKRILYIFPAS